MSIFMGFSIWYRKINEFSCLFLGCHFVSSSFFAILVSHFGEGFSLASRNPQRVSLKRCIHGDVTWSHCLVIGESYQMLSDYLILQYLAGLFFERV